ncbi:MAG: hypothetical protein K0Q59_5516 [Paenibacillus sp.]|nr:hypothetical protein [Paenibacillus sp.]
MDAAHPLLIHPPRSRLLLAAFYHGFMVFMVVLLSFNFFIFFSVLLLGFFIFSYTMFTLLWKRYTYSAALLHSFTLLIFLVSLAVAGPVRNGIYHVLSIVFT